jgi:hypothetical protein
MRALAASLMSGLFRVMAVVGRQSPPDIPKPIQEPVDQQVYLPCARAE